MNSVGLYLAATVIWGSTWIAITYQLGVVPAEVSVAYRFALAALILFAYCGVRRLSLRFSPLEHLWMGVQGALLFGINYIFVYLAEGLVNSGLVAVVFSLMVFMNMIGSRICFSTPLRRGALVGAALGVGGLSLLFLHDLTSPSATGLSVWGLLLALGSAFVASLGNLAAARNQGRGLPVVQLNAFGMLYGAVLVALYAFLAGRPLAFDWSPAYVGSLLYLAVFGSVLAFGAYLTLMARIGPDRAGYIAVAVPVVALVLSTFFEGLRWRPEMVGGVALCLAGNLLVLRRKSAATR